MEDKLYHRTAIFITFSLVVVFIFSMSLVQSNMKKNERLRSQEIESCSKMDDPPDKILCLIGTKF